MPHHHPLPLPPLLHTQTLVERGAIKQMSCWYPDSISLGTCIHVHCPCVQTTIRMCSRVDIYRDICEVLAEWLPSCCLQQRLCCSCAQTDRASVTCNESLALSIMSALLDKSLHFQRICPITSNTAREKGSKRAEKAFAFSHLLAFWSSLDIKRSN